MFSKALKRTAASLTCFFFTYSIMLPTWADVIQQSASDGNAAAAAAMNDFELPSFNSESGEILFMPAASRPTSGRKTCSWCY